MIPIVSLLKGVLGKFLRMSRITDTGGRSFELGFARADVVPAPDRKLAENAATSEDDAAITDEDPDIALARLIEAARGCEGKGQSLNELSRTDLIRWALAV